MNITRIDYVARLIVGGHVQQTIEFEATDDREAWRLANDGVNVLIGAWAEVRRKPNPQQALDI
jgi:hypothetical protein